jgi:hypothetical protein
MIKRKRYFFYALALTVVISGFHATARASDPAFDAITKHLKTQYKARKRRVPFMGLAKFAVKLIHPAGIKSLKLAIFEELDHAPVAGNNELNAIMRNALSPQWQPLVRIRSRDGEQMYVYATDEGNSVKLLVVNIDGSDAFVARVKLDPEKLKEFLDNPKILGISLKQ